MSASAWGQRIAAIDAAGTLYNTFTTAKSMLTSSTATAASAGAILLPPNFFQVGGSLNIFIVANISTVVTTVGTITGQVMLGPTANIIAFTTGAINTSIVSHVLSPAHIWIKLRCVSIGNGTLAALEGSSVWQSIAVVGAASQADSVAGTAQTVIAPTTAGASGTGFDSTVANLLDFFMAQTISGATTGFQLREYEVWSAGNSSQ